MYKDETVYLIGRRFGKWRILKLLTDKAVCYAVCQCDCGKVAEVILSHLLRRKTTSCGCGGKGWRTKAVLKAAKEQHFPLLKCRAAECQDNKRGLCCWFCYDKDWCPISCKNDFRKCGAEVIK